MRSGPPLPLIDPRTSWRARRVSACCKYVGPLMTGTPGRGPTPAAVLARVRHPRSRQELQHEVRHPLRLLDVDEVARVLERDQTGPWREVGRDVLGLRAPPQRV